MVIAVFVLAHWYLSIFCQTFFLHRYAAHRMYSMPLAWERFFYLLTLATQGIILTPPKAFAVMHRLHHAHIETEEDPHSPKFHKTPVHMAIKTVFVFLDIFKDPSKAGEDLAADCPEWPAVDRLIEHRGVRLLWALVAALFYVWFYRTFATAAWMYIFLPLHFYMGLIHGAAVNWCGHKYGYRNFNSRGGARNTLPMDVVFIGEFLHNNHHSNPQRPNFAMKKFEWDPTYVITKIFSQLGILRFNEKTEMR